MSVTKPFLKWVGGKTQILGDILEVIPKQLSNYYEPFIGGGSILFGVLSYIKNGSITITGKIYASDLNSNLIGLYKNIQSQPDALLQEVKLIVDEFSKCETTEVNRKPTTHKQAQTSPESYYYWIRSRFNALSNEERQTLKGSAMLLFLNKTCFRGLYREGPNGFNVPFGNYKNPSVVDEEHIRSVSELIQNVIFTTCSFADSLSKVVSGDFVYLDPPYAPETTTSFVSYTSDGFGIDNHTSLFNICEQMNRKNVKFLLSNADVTLVKEAFPNPPYKTRVISCRRTINSKNPESKTNEVLISN